MLSDVECRSKNCEAEMSDIKHFRVSLKKSGIGRPEKHKLVLKGLGLTRFGKTVSLKDTPAIRGMLKKVVHLVKVEPVQGPLKRD